MRLPRRGGLHRAADEGLDRARDRKGSKERPSRSMTGAAALQLVQAPVPQWLRQRAPQPRAVLAAGEDERIPVHVHVTT